MVGRRALLALLAATCTLQGPQAVEAAAKASGFQEALEALICKRLPVEIRKLSKKQMEEKAVDEPHWFLKQLSWAEVRAPLHHSRPLTLSLPVVVSSNAFG
jgi:ribosomal protein S12 methylthiotransferase accessory factor YcaO